MAHNAGNINMRGKKYKLLNCKCCACEDLREKELIKEHKKQIKNYYAEVGRNLFL